MIYDKAKEIQKLMNQIEKCEKFLKCLDKGYQDEFQIAYNGSVVCELEKGMLNMIKTCYKDSVAACIKELEKI